MSNPDTVKETVEQQPSVRGPVTEDDREASGAAADWCACLGVDCAERGCWASRQRERR
jgi:hypothetical protein